jgi:hypothetical protein
MENILDCAICLEHYDNKEKMPRILRCGHTFCTRCLTSLTKVNNSEPNINTNHIKCPLDKQIGHSNLKIEEIPINRYLIIKLNNL